MYTCHPPTTIDGNAVCIHANPLPQCNCAVQYCCDGHIISYTGYVVNKRYSIKLINRVHVSNIYVRVPVCVCACVSVFTCVVVVVHDINNFKGCCVYVIQLIVGHQLRRIFPPLSPVNKTLTIKNINQDPDQ